LIMNQSSLERGLFTTSSYRTHKDEEKRNQAQLEEEKFCKPMKYLPNGSILTRGMKQGSYEKLDENGLIKVGSKVDGNDIIIGKILPLKQVKPNEPKFKDASVSIYGNVDWVYSNKNGDGYKFAKIRIRTDKIPENGDKHSCYDDMTEVLTDSGFKYFKDLRMTDKVATLVDGAVLRYDHPINIMEYGDVEEMYSYKDDRIDLCITLNHNVYVKQVNQDNYKLEKIENIMGQIMWMKKDVVNNYRDAIGITDEWLKSFGEWLYHRSITDLNDFKSLSNNGKNLPDIVWNLSQRQCRILLDELFKSKFADYFYTYRETLANDVQRLCLHSGYSADRLLDVVGGTGRGWLVIMMKTSMDNMPLLNGYVNKEKIIDYRGRSVYCCEVPSNVIYVRRNGVCIWSGNSRHG